MAIVPNNQSLDALLPVAERQSGYFTTAQAAKEGVAAKTLGRITNAGHLDRISAGIYRLARWPAAEHDGLWPVYLWGTLHSERAVLSHRTALQLYNISDINPNRIDLTIPPKVRIRAATPGAVTLHRREFEPKDVVLIDGLPVTTPFRTLVDLTVDRVARDAVAEVIDSGSAEHLIPAEYLKQVRALFDLTPETRRILKETLISEDSVQARVKRARQ